MGLAKLMGRAIGRNIREKRKKEQLEIKALLADFDQNQMRMFSREYEARKKSVGLGYVCLACAGCHYAYTDKWLKQLVFWATLGGLFMWWLVDLFLMYFVIDSYNRKLSLKIIQEVYEVNYRRLKNKKAKPPHVEVPTTMAKRPEEMIPPTIH